MAKLINGNGNTAIWAAQDADLIASICGNVTAIAAVGSQFSYTQEDANTIGVADGVIITKEGRRIQLDSGNVDLFTIPTGQLNVTSYYIIGYKLVQNSDTTQTCETFVQKMDNATDVITENTFRGGSTEVYVSLYRVTQVGMNIDTVDLMLPLIKDLFELINDLTNLHNVKSVTKSNVSTNDGGQIPISNLNLESGAHVLSFSCVGGYWGFVREDGAIQLIGYNSSTEQFSNAKNKTITSMTINYYV